LAAELENEFGIKPALVQSSGGIFEVEVDGKLVYSKKATLRFPEPGEVNAILKSLDSGIPLEEAQAQASANAPKPPSLYEWLSKFLSGK
jgi:selT/selW/selH-like putative selenoprotein